VNRRRESRGASGYSLVEVVVALALVGVALLVATNALQAHAMAAKRLEVRQQLLQAAENVLESLRGRAVPLAGGAIDADLVGDGRSGHTVHTFVEVAPGGIDGLHRVTVRARTRLRGLPEELELETMIWRP
jgi:prepilin-type N-terminal cleavage/methylation domain-containing protein